MQHADGWIPWEAGRHVDPWNMVEAAIGLDCAGLHEAARRAYGWLAEAQRQNGSWAARYQDGAVADATVDANFCAYPATGIWFHFLKTGDERWLRKMWPVVEKVLDHVLDMQLPSGAIAWARDPQGVLWEEALVTSSSSIFHSLWCGITIAGHLGHERPDWELSLAVLQRAIALHEGPFMDKSRFAMDHYYPALTSTVDGAEADGRLDACLERFVVPGRGCRCTDDRPWMTSGETSELAVALSVHDRTAIAGTLLEWLGSVRDDDGMYWTGVNHPDGTVWPLEKTTWSAGAVLMAADALDGGPVRDLFSGAALIRRAEFDLSDAGEWA